MSATVIPIRKPQYTMTSRAGDTYPIDHDVSEIVNEGLARIALNEEAKDFLAAANRLIQDRHGTNIDIHGPLGIVNVSEYLGLKITDYQELRKAFNNDLDEITRADGSIDFKRIQEIACDADDARSGGIRNSIAINRVVRVTWVSINNRLKEGYHVVRAS